MIRTSLLIALSLVAGAAFAQEKPYAVVKKVSGIVTVSSDKQSFAAVNDMPLKKGQEVLVGAAGSVTIAFEKGCTADLKPKDKLVIDEEQCKAFVAGAAAAAGAGAGAIAANNVGAVIAGTVAAVVLISNISGF